MIVSCARDSLNFYDSTNVSSIVHLRNFRNPSLQKRRRIDKDLPRPPFIYPTSARAFCRQFVVFLQSRKEKGKKQSKIITFFSVDNPMDVRSILGNNHIENVRWLCSLSESELDFLMGLKTLVHQRAKKIGHEALVKKFDLRTLRALSFVLMENLKGELKDLSATSECNLLSDNLNGLSSMKIEELIPFICSDKRKRISDMFSQDMPPSQKQKTGD